MSISEQIDEKTQDGKKMKTKFSSSTDKESLEKIDKQLNDINNKLSKFDAKKNNK